MFSGVYPSNYRALNAAFAATGDYLAGANSDLKPIAPSSIGDSNNLKWQRPPTGFLKFNCDGAFSSKDKQAAFGVLARDSRR